MTSRLKLDRFGRKRPPRRTKRSRLRKEPEHDAGRQRQMTLRLCGLWSRMSMSSRLALHDTGGRAPGES